MAVQDHADYWQQNSSVKIDWDIQSHDGCVELFPLREADILTFQSWRKNRENKALNIS